MQQLRARAAAKAAEAIGMTASTAMAAVAAGLISDSHLKTQAVGFQVAAKAAELQASTSEAKGLGTTNITEQHDEQSFTCTVCRKVFKREMNLIFHMTTHRPRQPQPETSDAAASQPVKCQDCGKEFATKYQAKKHYLRRHFQGEKPFACPKCKKKRFVVKEDLTMHMKSCGNVYVCNCGIRLCSLGALKRHCKYFKHEPESLEPRPDPSMLNLDWNSMDGAGPLTRFDDDAGSRSEGDLARSAELMHLQTGQYQHMGEMSNGELPLASTSCSASTIPASSSMHLELLARLHGKRTNAMQSCLALSALMRPMGASSGGGDAITNSIGFPLSHVTAQGFADRLPVAAAPACVSCGGCGDYPSEPALRSDQQLTPEMLQGMMPSLAQALCQAQVYRVAKMERNVALIN